MATLLLNTTPDQETLAKLIEPRLAAAMPIVLPGIWNDKSVAQSLTTPEGAQFLAGKILQSLGLTNGLLDLADLPPN